MGIQFPVMTNALEHVDPFTFTLLRYLIAGALLLPLMLVKEGAAAFRFERGQLARAWLLGSIGFCGFGSFVFLGQQLAGDDGALTASIMMATQPMMGLLVNSLVRRTAPPLYTFLFILMSFSGVTLVVTKGNIAALLNEPQNYSANALIVIGALCWVIYTFSAPSFKGWSALRYTTTTMWLGLSSILALNVLLIALGAIPAPTKVALMTIVPDLFYMGTFAGVFSILFWNIGNNILTPLNGVLFMDVLPVTTFTISAFTGVIPTRVQVTGACITGTALIINNLYLRYRALSPA